MITAAASVCKLPEHCSASVCILGIQQSAKIHSVQLLCRITQQGLRGGVRFHDNAVPVDNQNCGCDSFENLPVSRFAVGWNAGHC